MIMKKKEILWNIYADKNNPIKNTFKKSGENYIEELNEINNGLDYDYTFKNQYDLYNSINCYTKNKVILNIYGGAWLIGDKRYKPEAEFWKNLTKLGFITSSLV